MTPHPADIPTSCIKCLSFLFHVWGEFDIDHPKYFLDISSILARKSLEARNHIHSHHKAGSCQSSDKACFCFSPGLFLLYDKEAALGIKSPGNLAVSCRNNSPSTVHSLMRFGCPQKKGHQKGGCRLHYKPFFFFFLALVCALQPLYLSDSWDSRVLSRKLSLKVSCKSFNYSDWWRKYICLFCLVLVFFSWVLNSKHQTTYSIKRRNCLCFRRR